MDGAVFSPAFLEPRPHLPSKPCPLASAGPRWRVGADGIRRQLVLRAAWLMGSSSCIPSQDQAARMHDKIVGCRMLGAGEQRGELS